MKLMLPETSALLQKQFPEHDQVPRLKIFNPNGCHTWLICGQDPVEPDQLFGLCDLGQGFPELGYVSPIRIGQAPLRLRLAHGARYALQGSVSDLGLC